MTPPRTSPAKGTGRIPAAVLSQQLADAIAGRRVRTAVFTTFSFDPGFFELHILPVLFDQSFSQSDKIRRIHLEDALRSLDEMAVYYDRNALAQDAEPAQLDYRRIDVGRSTGYFHPKIVLLLVDDPTGAEAGDETGFPTHFPSLLVGLFSANLTRSGWWENVECGHIEEIKDRDWRDVRIGERSRPHRCPFRRDLMALLRRVRDSADPGEDQVALRKIRRFLRDRTVRRRFTRARSKGRYHTRIFFGQDRLSLAGWLSELRLYTELNLEVISPFFDSGGPGPLVDLIDALEPRAVRVFLPRDLDGIAQVTEGTYREIADLGDWADLPGEIISRGRDRTAGQLPPRRVHAKVYRLWSRQGDDLLLVGSPNLTRAGHARVDAGNLEAAFLVDIAHLRLPRRWWLERSEDPPGTFVAQDPDENEGLQPAPFALSLRFDWAEGELAYRLGEAAPGGFTICDTTGGVLAEVPKPRRGRWMPCAPDSCERIREILLSTSFLLVQHAKGSWRVLVREENMSRRPSLLTQLTPEEILEYWSLLTAEQRAALIERLTEGAADQGIPLFPPDRLVVRHTIFDRFAGIYHAFGCMKRYVSTAIDEGRERAAEARLLGAKYDSLPSLLEKSLTREGEDPILRYVTFLCARQVRRELQKLHAAFFRKRRKQTAQLDALIDRLDEARAMLPLDEIEGGSEFIQWYEETFLRPVALDEEIS
ncbi:MAG: hypothetical protein GF330_04530 [Candidatus Eisenbacteria bacterium]|nr:hypothetical protein [Candidatus Eisenbacteria bacterium]